MEMKKVRTFKLFRRLCFKRTHHLKRTTLFFSLDATGFSLKIKISEIEQCEENAVACLAFKSGNDNDKIILSYLLSYMPITSVQVTYTAI